MDALEPRRLLAAADLITAVPTEEYNESVPLAGGPSLLYTQYGVTAPEALLVGDGAGGTAVTLLTAAVQDAGYNTGVTALTTFGGKAYFFANTIVSGERRDSLMVTDGAAAGTQEVARLSTGQSAPLPTQLFQLNGRLHYLFNGGLWSTDGTPGGTTLVTPLAAPFEPVIVSGGLGFFNNNGQQWRTDGTASGTFALGLAGGSPGQLSPPAATPLVVAGGKVFFLALAQGASHRLYVIDAAGANAVKVNLPQNNTLFENYVFNNRLLVSGSHVVFTSYEPQSQNVRLFASDGTDAGTVKLVDGTSNVSLFGLTQAAPDKTVFMMNNDGVWATDGTIAGTQRIRAQRADEIAVAPFASTLGQAFLYTNPGSGGVRLLATDGTVAGTRPLHYLEPGAAFTPIAPEYVATRGNRIIVRAANNGNPQLWSLDTTAQTGTITGLGFFDNNRNGSYEAFETTLAGTAYIDLNANGVLDSGETRRTASGGGRYLYDGLIAPGRYVVRFNPSSPNSGLPITSPAGGSHVINLAPGQQVTAEFITPASTTTIIWGRLFNDANANGVQDAGEGPVTTPQRVYLDLNGNGFFDTSEPNVMTAAADGTYGLVPPSSAGGTYTVRRQDQLGFRQTSPANRGGVTVTVPQGQAVQAGDIGLTAAAPATIQGIAWADADADGVRDAGETGRGSVYVELLDETGSVRATTNTTGGGLYSFANLITELPYRVRFTAINTPPNPTLTLSPADQGGDDTLDSDPDPQTLTTPFMVLAPGQTLSNVDAGTYARTTISGVVFRDTGGDGARDAASDPPLVGWTVYADDNGNSTQDPGEPFVVSSSTGTYTLNLTPGTHRIAAVAPAGWAATTPIAARTVTLSIGQQTAAVDVGYGVAGPSRRTTPVGPEFRVSETTGANEQLPSIGTDAAGNAVVVWFADPDRIMARRFDAAGNALGGEFQVNAVAVAAGAAPKVAVQGDGKFVIVWRAADGSVQARRFDAAGTALGDAVVVNQTTGGKAGPVVAIDPTGGFGVAWNGATTGDTAGVAARLFDAAGAPRTDEFRINDFTTGSQTVAGVVFDAGGRMTVAYNSSGQGVSGANAYARRFNADGSADGAGFRLAETSATATTTPGQVAINAAGDRLFTWSSGNRVYARLFAPDNTPAAGSVTLDTTNTTATVSNLAVAAGADGYFLVAWNRPSSGTTADVSAQLVGPNGVPHGREVRLNTYTTDAQAVPTLAVGAGASFVTAWQSNGQDGTGLGVYAQRVEVLAAPATVGDFVWEDADGDGVQDLGEAGVGGVTVELYNDAGSFAESVVTAADGSYCFNALKPGAGYQLRFALPANHFFSPANSGVDDSLDSDVVDPATGRTAVFTASATPGGADDSLDVGLTSYATLRGTVFHDLDGDGALDAGEPALGGANVFIDADADGRFDPGEISSFPATDGLYTFTGLVPGTYTVGIVPFLRWTRSTPTSGLTLTLSPGQAGTVNLGMTPDAPATTHVAAAGPEFRVNTTTAGAQFNQDVATDAAGNFVVVWNSAGSIRGQRYDATGVPLGGEFTIGTGSTSPAPQGVSASMADDGRFVVAWGDGSEVYARRYAADATPLVAAGIVNVTTADVQTLPDVTLDAAGNYVVAWQTANQDAAGQEIYARRYNADGTPRGGEFRVNAIATDNQRTPSIASDAGGAFVVSWVYAPSYGQWIMARRFDASGQPVGDDFTVQTSPAGTHSYTPSVAMNASGEFVIAYENSGVLVRRYDAQGQAQGLAIPAYGTRASRNSYGNPSAAIADDGSFVVGWQESQYEVGAQAFNNSGIKIGRELLVNTTTANFQFDPAVALQPGGSFVVAWTSDKQDGNDYGVYAQRFASYTDPPASVGGVVFVDADNDNVRDPGEAGRDGVAVTLFDEWGGVVGRATTANGGQYRFDEVRPGFAHRIQVTLPAATFVFDAKDAGGDDAVDSDVDPTTGFTDLFTLGAGAVDLTRFAGIVPLVNISGVKFQDLDVDGVRDANEPGLAGWTIFLDADSDGLLDATERSTSTDANGLYAFTNILPGTYRVAEVTLSRWQLTTAAGDLSVTLTPGQSTTTVNLGGRPTAAPTTVAKDGPERGLLYPDTPSDYGHRHNYIAADAQGNYVLTGTVYTGGSADYDAVARLFDAAGNPRGPQFMVSQAVLGSQVEPAAVMRPDGSFVIAWHTSGSADLNTSIFAQRFAADGQRIGNEFRVSSVGAVGETAPDVALTPDGGFVIAWEGPDATGRGVFARRFNATGQPLGSDIAVNQTTFRDESNPHVAVDGSGNFVVVWEGGNASGIFGRRFDAAGAPRGDEFVASSGSSVGGGMVDASVAANASGEFVIAWQNGGIYTARYDANGVRQGAQQRVNAGFGYVPFAGIDDDGNYLIVWQDGSGVFPTSTGVSDIRARRYDGSGLPLEAEQVINTVTAGEQVDSEVVMLPGGDYYLAWHTRQSPGGTSVQRFERSAPAQPAWLLAPAGAAAWDASTHTLTVTGAVTITADPGPDAPIVTANGAAAVLTIAPAAGAVVNLGGLALADGAVAVISSEGASCTLAIDGAHFSLGSTSTLDVGDNAVVIRGGDTSAAVRSAIASAFNQGNWNGPGITSSVAATAADPGGVTAVGYATAADLNRTTFAGVSGLSASDVLVKFTYAGDANLDGKVDIGDMGLLAGAWQQTSGKYWFDGDFTYDGAVNIGDLGLLAGNWQKGVGNPI